MQIEEIKKLDNQYYLEVFGERLPAAFDHAADVYLYDTEGKRYTDFLAGIAVNALGYSDEGFKTAVKSQIDKLIHTSNYYYVEPQALLAQALCEKTGMDRVFFGNSGAEANECAIKIAKKYAYMKGSDSANFVSLKNSFHGRTVATLTATGQAKFHEPFEPGTFRFDYIDANDMDAANRTINAKTCGVLLEVIQGEGGIIPLDPAFVQHIRKLCDEHDVLLIVDEIQTGMGRTGKFLAQEHYGIKSDIVTLAKALGNGIPIGACLTTQKAADTFTIGDHGSTFGGNHLACTAALYVTNAIDETVMQHNMQTGEYFKNRLVELMNKYPKSIADVRGIGLLLSLDLIEPLSATDMKKALFENAFVVGTAGSNALRFAPPYPIRTEHIDELIDCLERLLS